jgi:hypothetical protein
MRWAKDRAFEVFDAVDVDGHLGVDVAAHGADQEACCDVAAIADLQPPESDGVVPFLLEDFGVGLQVFV